MLDQICGGRKRGEGVLRLPTHTVGISSSSTACGSWRSWDPRGSHSGQLRIP
jgi:hypothetical protein